MINLKQTNGKNKVYFKGRLSLGRPGKTDEKGQLKGHVHENKQVSVHNLVDSLDFGVC